MYLGLLFLKLDYMGKKGCGGCWGLRVGELVCVFVVVWFVVVDEVGYYDGNLFVYEIVFGKGGFGIVWFVIFYVWLLWDYYELVFGWYGLY